MLVFTTRLPLASMICASDHPSRLLRTCPRWSGLLVLGDEYSIITSGEASVTGFSPNFSFWFISLSSASHAFLSMTRLRKPPTALKSAIASQFCLMYSPISRAVSSGFLREILRNGNTTSVRLPSNSFLVF